LDVSIEADLEDELFLAELDRIEQVIHKRAFAIFLVYGFKYGPGAKCAGAKSMRACACVCTLVSDECASQEWRASL
jgi:hypothetical protein